MAIRTARILSLGVLVALPWSLSPGGEARADIYVCEESQGTIQFTNVPARSGCRALIRGWSKESFSPSSAGRFEDTIRLAAGRYGVDPHLVRAVIKVESDFNFQARSHKGAQGLMQLMPETAQLHNVGNVYDPDENIDGGVRHLRLLLDRYRGDLSLTLAAYNAGIKAVERYGGIPPYSETRDYVRRVLDYYQRYRRNGAIAIREQAGR